MSIYQRLVHIRYLLDLFLDAIPDDYFFNSHRGWLLKECIINRLAACSVIRKIHCFLRLTKFLSSNHLIDFFGRLNGIHLSPDPATRLLYLKRSGSFLRDINSRLEHTVDIMLKEDSDRSAVGLFLPENIS